MKPKNLLDMVRRTVDRFPDKKALMWKEAGSYHDITYREMWKELKDLASGLALRGVGAGDKVAILSENHPKWPISDLAILSLGAVSVPIYPTLPSDQTAYILKNADCKAVLVEDGKQLAKVREGGAKPELFIGMMNGEEHPLEEGFEFYPALVEEGARIPLPEWENGFERLGRDDLATIIHTSGTTGPPKGVMLTHGNFLANIEGVQFWCFELLPEDVTLSYLPLSHVFERMAGQYMPLSVGATIAYAESIDTIQENLQEVKPTVMTSVPRLFEKMYERVREQANTPLRKRIFNWAIEVGGRWYDCYVQTQTDRLLLSDPFPPELRRQWRIADRLVYRKVKERLGGNLRGMVSGGAPLHPEVARFFWSIGLPVLEGYGLTETAPVIAANPIVRAQVGTVGKPLPNLDVRIAPDGEVLVKGPSVMKGYYKNEQATAEQLKDGWFHTGDLGELDEDGYLRIIDRKKNILVLSTGKNLAPQPVENAINQSPYIAQSVMVGNRRKYPIVLVVPEFHTLASWARQKELPVESFAQLAGLPETGEFLKKEVKRLTSPFARYEQPKKVLVAREEWTVEGGELTPTLKVRMPIIEGRYKDWIEGAYAEEPSEPEAAATKV
ncbi:AMP-dependent synthetase/ligase [Salinithrix halophila]|uniref:AMP-dependent synthetase/ligase n=1 Tax=Salinithrix halophila TaxID=1485204 RepID=A0ABV8JB79_9BACL